MHLATNNSLSTYPNIRFPAKTEYLADLGGFLQRHCQQSDKIAIVELATTEIVVNAINHGQASYYEVYINASNNDLEIIIIDDGLEFNPLQPTGLKLGELREGGYGLAIVQQIAQSCSYQRQAHHNYFRMVF